MACASARTRDHRGERLLSPKVTFLAPTAQRPVAKVAERMLFSTPTWAAKSQSGDGSEILTGLSPTSFLSAIGLRTAEGSERRLDQMWTLPSLFPV